MPRWAHSVGEPLLFDTRQDEAQEHNLAGTAIEKEYEDKLRQALQEIRAPVEQLQRLKL